MYTMYNRPAHEWKALDKLLKEAYDNGRKAGFAAGYAAAQGQPREKIEQAYEQGQKAALLHKNGCGY